MRPALRLLRAIQRVGMPAVAVLCAGLLLAAWALSIILTPPAASAGPAGFTTVQITRGEVGSRLSLNVAAEWAPTPVGTNQAAGIVTAVEAPTTAALGQGARLFAVDGRPVVVARGDTPAYRALAAGASGDDVRQLQGMLADLGYLDGSFAGPADGTPDGTLGDDDVEAVQRWQQSLGVPATGEVAFGDIIFVPALPARLTVRADVVKRGARVGGGEEAVLSLGTSPVFTLSAGDSQSAQIPTGARVAVDSPAGDSWSAVVAGRAAAASGATVVLGLAAAPTEGGPVAQEEPDGAGPAPSGAEGASSPGPQGGDGSDASQPICRDACDSIPLTGQTLLSATVVTVEPVQGAVVPTIALQTDAGQQLSLVDTEGNVHPVTVEAEAHGMSVIEGVEPGLTVRVPESTAAFPGSAGVAPGSAGAAPDGGAARSARNVTTAAPTVRAAPGDRVVTTAASGAR